MIRILLFPLAVLWSLLLKLRNYLYDSRILKSTQFNFPVIVVGNVSLGGTGKTQMMQFLIEHFRPNPELVVLSRGYKRKTKGFKEVLSNETALSNGDESMMMKIKYSEVSFFVGENRVDALNKIQTKINSPIALLDDAYQHRRLKPGLSIVLFNYNELDSLLLFPAGRLRDNLYRLQQADILIITKCPIAITNAQKTTLEKKIKCSAHSNLYYSTLNYGAAYAMNEPQKRLAKTSNRFVVFSGIAKPDDMIKYLSSHGEILRHFNFADHHTFTKEELKEIRDYFDNIVDANCVLITSEKDAARLYNTKALEVFSGVPLYVQPVRIEFLEQGDKELLINKIEDYVKRNLRSNSVYSA